MSTTVGNEILLFMNIGENIELLRRNRSFILNCGYEDFENFIKHRLTHRYNIEWGKVIWRNIRKFVRNHKYVVLYDK